MKNPLTPAWIETASYRFVTQHLNHCATAVPKILYGINIKVHTVVFNLPNILIPTQYNTTLCHLGLQFFLLLSFTCLIQLSCNIQGHYCNINIEKGHFSNISCSRHYYYSCPNKSNNDPEVPTLVILTHFIGLHEEKCSHLINRETNIF